MSAPWHAYLLLLSPGRVGRRLARVRADGCVQRVPNLWQLEIAVLRMWHRILFRFDTIGTCTAQRVRLNWRAKLLSLRPLRFFGLLVERAITPWDLSGFLSSRAQFMRHLIGAHHDGTQFVYDLQILSLYPGALEELRQQVHHVVCVDSARNRWLRDLTVYEDYHESLLDAVDRVLDGARELDASDATNPDISFFAYLDWCARQPANPGATWAAWRAGRFDWVGGLRSP